nr:DUF4357 domain-containing protein [Pinirhizobacter soli]
MARCTAEGLWVIAGSTGRGEVSNSLRVHAYRDLRSTLLGQGVISEVEDGRIRFERDHLFKRPSSAAVAVMGRAANGWIEWRDAQGVSLHEACNPGSIATGE